MVKKFPKGKHCVLFHSNNCGAIAGILVSGFTQHLTMISGLYTGLVPTPAGPVPTPVPWMGVS